MIDVLDAVKEDPNASRSLLCQHLVIIGGTNESSADFVQTPDNEMNGSVVLANAVRGLSSPMAACARFRSCSRSSDC